MASTEERVAQKLKAYISEADTPSSLVAEFRKYSELMKREGLKRILRGERESLLSAYRDLIGIIILKIKISDKIAMSNSCVLYSNVCISS